MYGLTDVQLNANLCASAVVKCSNLEAMIKILADASSDLSQETAAGSGITLIPAYIHFEGQKVRSDEITSAEVLRMVQETRRLPMTSEPTREDWANAYEAALQEADEVISLHMASGLSRSFETASHAARLFEGRVHTLDSQSGTYALGLQALRAANMADHSVEAADILADLRGVGRKQFAYFMVDTLDYLKMSGRVSGALATLGNLFGIKPLLRYQEGEIVMAGRVRGQSRAMTELSRILVDYAAQNPGGLRVAYLYTPGGEANVEALRHLMASWGYKEDGTHLVGPTMAAVTGPGAVGLVAELVRPLPKGRTPGHSRGRHEPLNWDAV